MTLEAVIDLDFVKYAVASIAETRSIKVIHTTSGNEKEFKNRTEFYGRGKKQDGGWLGELNEGRETPFLASDFIIEDIQEVTEPIANTLHSAKMMVKSGLKGIGTEDYISFLGEGDSFRVGASTLLEYKGARKELIKPLLLDDITEYLERTFKPEIITDIEVDDKVVMESYNNPNRVILGVDKDYYGCPVKFFNHNRPAEGIVDCNGFGGLYRDVKKKVRGKGRVWLYQQVASHDIVDCYKANCFSDKPWGEVKPYEILSKTTNDKEAFEALVGIFKHLYPEPKVITGWRGDEFEIDWLYVMQEMFTMAHMRRWENDSIDVISVMDKMGVEYGKGYSGSNQTRRY